MALSDEIPVRSNGQEILAAWFNTLRTVILSFFGTESSFQTVFVGLASQTDEDITDLVFNGVVTRKVEITYVIVTPTLVESGNSTFLNNGSSWTAYHGGVQGPDSGVTFDINSSTGQVEYTSSSEAFQFHYKTETFDV